MNIIKKVASALITLLLLLTNLSCIKVSCNSDLTVTEARKLIYDALNLFNHVQLANPTLFAGQTISANGNWYTLIDETKLPGGSYKAMQEYAKQIYTEDLAPKMYEKPWSPQEIPAFIWDDSGNIYVCAALSGGYPIDFGYSLYDWQSYSLLKVEDLTIKVAQINEKSASVWIKVLTKDYQPYWLECSMVKTDIGWRIDKSVFTDYLRTPYIDINQLIPYTSSPSTADPTFDLVFILPTVSVAAIASAFCLTRRRRRENVP